MSIVVFNPDVYGHIQNPGAGPWDMSGTTLYPRVSKYANYRAYLSFNTSSLPDGAAIQDVEFRSYMSSSSSEPYGASVGDYAIKFFYAWDQIGASIDAGEWGAFTSYDSRKSWGTHFADGEAWTHPLGVDTVNKAGDSDYELKGDSYFTDPPGGPTWYLVIQTPLGNFYTWLTITYGLKGVLNRFGGAKMWHGSQLCLASLTKSLQKTGVIPARSSVLGWREDDELLVQTKFLPRAVIPCL